MNQSEIANHTLGMLSSIFEGVLYAYIVCAIVRKKEYSKLFYCYPFIFAFILSIIYAINIYQLIFVIAEHQEDDIGAVLLGYLPIFFFAFFKAILALVIVLLLNKYRKRKKVEPEDSQDFKLKP